MSRLAGAPKGETHIPDTVMRYAAGREIQVVWLNELGGTTFCIGGDNQKEYIKWVSPESPINLRTEKIKLEWAAAFTPVPKVLEYGENSEGAWLTTVGMNAQSAVSDKWITEPAIAVTAIGRGLRKMHDSLPVTECPFTWSTKERTQRAIEKITNGTKLPKDLHPEFSNLSAKDILFELEHPPVSGTKVVCHGDACAPNTLIDSNGNWAGHVDLGNLGVAEPAADLVVAAWSTKWNYGPGWENLLYEAYGTEPDATSIRFYRLLWDITD